ncbi:hypothetical protein J27TS7_10910 [Paenibacillus dendritiformis]|uniref:hypothetical protein n=1 Tax=Paenibacillus dendritiformis TaxID=130049 RepID=UPI001B0E865F|nr:hypothetical protein [Paenibacillus dendritiformis]GIO71577.1 hypothetical protein J27TS7_10910 [Paenibacillus dendritiformis]
MRNGLIYGEMAEQTTQPFRLFGNLSGEMSVNDVPLAPGVRIDELKKGDDDPLEVVVEIPASRSKRGWNYRSQSLKDIVDAVMTKTLNGFLGHQKPEDVNNQFLPPVTHWVGAKMVGETAYFRGVVDAAAKDLKRWIRSNRINQVSIYGMPKLQRAKGETDVVGYNPLSIDWTPLDRAGMNTRIVAMSGEMWDLDGAGPEESKGDDEQVEWAQVLTEVKKKHGMKGFTIGTLAGEMGLTDEQVVAELTPEFAQQVQRALDVLGKAESILGVSGEMDVEELFKTLKAAADKEASASRDQIIGEMMESKVTSVAVRKDLTNPETPLGKMWSYHLRGIAADATKEHIAGEMDTFLADPVVKGIVDRYHTDPPAGAGRAGTGGGQAGGPQNLKTKRTSI